MKFNVLVTGGLYSSQSGYSALKFCEAAVAAGNSVSQVFFYQDGVTQATKLSVPLADEFDPVNSWVAFSKAHGIDLAVCVSASERRGILSSDQATEFSKPASNLHNGFRIEGLGGLHGATFDADRTVTFK